MLLSAGAMCAANFVTGQSARAVIGQPNFTAQVDDTTSDPNAGGFALGGVSGVAWANGTLFVVDSNRVGATPDNDRVVVYSNITSPTFVAGLTLPSPTQEIVEENFASYIRCPVCVVNASLIVGQPDQVTVGANLSQSGLNEPAGVASNGKILVIADTNNNRVLIWNSIPTVNNAPADIVLGQTSFNAISFPPTVSQTAMRGPESVWIQGNRLFVADTLNNRVLIWNSIPTQNNQPADLVLGQPNFTTTQSPKITTTPVTSSSDIISPTGVSSDGTHLFVADLGQNRVLIWNSIPTQNNQAADVEIGQPDMTTAVPNNSFSGLPATTSGSTDKETPVLCTTPQVNGADSNGNPTYPQRCAYTLSFPRYVLSDGTRLFVADSGNDRVLVYNAIPTQNTVAADVVLGQPDFIGDIVSDSGSSTDNVEISGADSVRTPMAMAWDGANLYVSDPFDRRVLVYSASDYPLPPNAAYNAASLETFASSLFTFAGTITTGDKVNITITDPNNTTAGYTAPVYTYTVLKNDTFDGVTKGLSNVINSSNSGVGDPVVFARAELGAASILLSARNPGALGNGVAYAVALTGVSSNAATETVSPSSGSTTGGTAAATLAPGTLISVFGTGLTDQPPAAAPAGAAKLPETLAGVELYIDGVRAPLLYVSSTQINAQVPFEFSDANGSSAWVRTQHADGSVTATNAIAIPLAPQNPGIFTSASGSDPRPALAFQATSNALAVIDIEGLPGATSVASLTIASSTYTYTVQTADVTAVSVTTTNPVNGVPTATTTSVTPDVLEIIRQSLLNQINADPNALVTAYEGSQFHYLILTAKTPGTAGNGIVISATATANGTTSLTLTVLTTDASTSVLGTCCASNGGTAINVNNPAVAGGFLVLYTTGLGTVISSDIVTTQSPNGIFCPTVSSAEPDQNFTDTGVVCTPPPDPVTGAPYSGPALNTVVSFVSATAGGSTANVFDASLVPGSIGVYRLLVQLDSSLTTNAYTPLTVYQDVYNSNTVTIPVQAQ
ncbi:MAG: hypothetical protein ABSF98_06220 [Bryobacteraceae bacterium]